MVLHVGRLDGKVVCNVHVKVRGNMQDNKGIMMKENFTVNRLVVAIGIVLVSATICFAEWLVDFQNNFYNEGIDKAVVKAMEEGIQPDPIVENGLQFSDLNPVNLVKALYCAGAKGQDIRDAAEKWDISEEVVAAGFKKAIAECNEKVADSQAFTPRDTASSFVSVTPGGGGGFASPSTF